MDNIMDPAVHLGKEFFRGLQENPGKCLEEMHQGFDLSQDQHQRQTHAVAVVQAFQNLANDPSHVRSFSRKISFEEIRNPQRSKKEILEKLFKIIRQFFPGDSKNINQLFSTMTSVESKTLEFADGSEKAYPASVLEELSPSHFAQKNFQEATTQRYKLSNIDQRTLDLLIKIVFSEKAVEALQDETEQIDLIELIRAADYFQNSQTTKRLIPLILESLQSVAEKQSLEAAISILVQCAEPYLMTDLIRVAETTNLSDRLVENLGAGALIDAFSTLPEQSQRSLTQWLKPAVVRGFVNELKNAAQVICSAPGETTSGAIDALDQTVLKWFDILNQFKLNKYAEIIRPFVNSNVSSKHLVNPKREILASLLEEVRSIIKSIEIFYNADNRYSELDHSATSYLNINGHQALELLKHKPVGYWLLRWSENHKRCCISIVASEKNERQSKEIHHFPLPHPSRNTWKSISFNTFWSMLPKFTEQTAYRKLTDKNGDQVLICPELCIGGFPKNKF